MIHCLLCECDFEDGVDGFGQLVVFFESESASDGFDVTRVEGVDDPYDGFGIAEFGATEFFNLVEDFRDPSNRGEGWKPEQQDRPY